MLKFKKILNTMLIMCLAIITLTSCNEEVLSELDDYTSAYSENELRDFQDDEDIGSDDIYVYDEDSATDTSSAEHVEHLEISWEISVEVVEPHIYIALGDSVAAGYGLNSIYERNTAMFRQKLEDSGYTYIEYYINKAVDGYTTTRVLNLLNNMDEEQRNLFGNARIITLNIGGNNILSPFREYLSQSIDFGEVISEGVDGMLEADGVGQALGGFALTIAEALRDAITIAATDAAAVLFGSFTPELEALLEQGTQRFITEFGEIITWLETAAPNAAIIVNTVHNPLPQQILIVPVELSNRAEELISVMNGVIFEESEARGFLVADIHARFTNEAYITELTAFNLNPLVGELSIDIIHPNAYGHSIIAQLKYEQYQLARGGD